MAGSLPGSAPTRALAAICAFVVLKRPRPSGDEAKKLGATAVCVLTDPGVACAGNVDEKGE